MSEPSFLPFPTDLVSAEELSGNLDPLGTLTHAEYLAEALLPVFTVRTWRGEAVSELMSCLSADAGKSKQMVAVLIFLCWMNPTIHGLDNQRLGELIDVIATIELTAANEGDKTYRSFGSVVTNAVNYSYYISGL